MEKLHAIYCISILVIGLGLTGYSLNAQQVNGSLTNRNREQSAMEKTIEETREYIGMWVTRDGYIRHELLPDNRYDEARGTRKSAYLGSYKVSGNHIDYKDDTGFTADGEFKDGVLYHAGMILYKENNNVD